MKKKLLNFCLLTMFPFTLIGSHFVYFPNHHDIERHRSQYYALPFLVNPAMVGSVSSSCQSIGRFSLNQRFQQGWRYPSNSIHMAYDQYVPQLRGGIGLMATHNYESSLPQTHSTINAMYSYVIPVTKNFRLRTGVQATIGQKNLDMNFSSPNLIITPHIATDNIIYPNFSAGVMGYSNRFFAGFAVHNINEPNVSFYNTPRMREYDYELIRRYSLQSGLEIPLGKKERGFSISPNLIVFYKHVYNFPDVHIGTYLSKGIWTAGVWYSSNYDALMLLAGIQKGRFRAGYSFDSNLTEMNLRVRAHEFTVAFDLFNRKKSDSNRVPDNCKMPIPAF